MSPHLTHSTQLVSLLLAALSSPHTGTASPVPPIPLAIAPTPSGGFHSTSGYCNPLPYLPMKTDLVGMSGPKEEANKEKEICAIESLNSQGSLDSNREDDRASLILALTLYNVRKIELSKATKVFEVQTSISPSFAEPSLLSLLPSCLPMCISPPLTLLLLPAWLTPYAAFPLSHCPGFAPATQRLSGLMAKRESSLEGGSTWAQSFRRITISCKGCLKGHQSVISI